MLDLDAHIISFSQKAKHPQTGNNNGVSEESCQYQFSESTNLKAIYEKVSELT